MLNGKNILITGGTGTIGTVLTETILSKYSPNVIRIYSRDESKQHYLSNRLVEFESRLRYFIGDIRDKERLNRAMKNVDIVFHLAALKHVGACEYNPFEAIKTNVMGIQNLIEVCIENEVERVVYTSTDKAATPCNTMGVTKLLGEKLITAANYYKGAAKTIFSSVRFGNVLGSRGSLIPIIEEQVKKNKTITLTHRDMTRYIMDINTAITLILDSLELAQGGEIFVAKMGAIKVIDLIEVLVDNFAQKHKKAVDAIKIEEIGMFAGEKLYEELFSIEESERTYEMENYYMIMPQIPEVKMSLNVDKYPKIKRFDGTKPFNSKEGPFLSKQEINTFLIES